MALGTEVTDESSSDQYDGWKRQMGIPAYGAESEMSNLPSVTPGGSEI
jgi:hypothetical protein